MLRNFFYKFPANIVRCFTGANTLWHLLAIALIYNMCRVRFRLVVFRIHS